MLDSTRRVPTMEFTTFTAGALSPNSSISSNSNALSSEQQSFQQGT
jgi:hypothetical protein